MEISENIPPRTFKVGLKRDIVLKDCAHITLSPEEQLTLKTASGSEYDIVRKSWGYYATPSVNGRLKLFGLRTVIVRNSTHQFYILLVESSKEQEFREYVQMEKLEILCWLDEDEHLTNLLKD